MMNSFTCLVLKAVMMVLSPVEKKMLVVQGKQSQNSFLNDHP